MSNVMSDQRAKKESILVDFELIGNEHFDISDLLHEAYLEGKKDYQKELKEKIQSGLQISAAVTSLFRSKLQELGTNVTDMFLRVEGFKEFEALVVIEDAQYYDKVKRWNAYNLAKTLNDGIDELDLNFSLMPHSENLQPDIIKSEGFYFKYASKK